MPLLSSSTFGKILIGMLLSLLRLSSKGKVTLKGQKVKIFFVIVSVSENTSATVLQYCLPTNIKEQKKLPDMKVGHKQTSLFAN